MGVYGAGGSRTERIQTVIHSVSSRELYVRTGQLPRKMISRSRGPYQSYPVMAVEIDLGPVRDEWESEYLMLAYDDIHAIEYFNQPLDAYWKRNGLTFHDMLLQSAAQYEVVMRNARASIAS